MRTLASGMLALVLLLACTGELLAPSAPGPRAPELGLVTHDVADADFARIRSLGIRHVRYTLYWKWMEPAPGRYDSLHLEFWRALEERAARHGVELLITVHSPPAHITRGDRTAFARFAADMARTYPGIAAWQVGNEWDSVPQFGDWFTHGSLRDRGRAYGALLREVYPAVKAANPAAVVVVGGIAEHPAELLAGMDEAGAAYDVLAVHVYAQDPGGHLLEVARLKHRLTAGRRVWVTEFGVMHPDDGDQLEDWRSVVEWNDSTRAFERLYGYALRSGGYGILRVDGSPRPVHDWLRTRGGP